MKNQTLFESVQAVVTEAFESAEVDAKWSAITISKRPDLADYQCNGAMGAGKAASTNPRVIAQKVVDTLADNDLFQEVSIAGPGFINLRLSDATLVQWAGEVADDARLGCPERANPETIVLDFGGPNVAKAMHVGHVRSLIIGDCLQRLFRFTGDTVVSDIHLGDWGLPIGMLIVGIREQNPDLPFFTDPEAADSAESPATLAELEALYPAMATRCSEDEELRAEVGQVTADLQAGHAGYRALWSALMAVSRESLEAELGRLGVVFDLWHGESSVNDRIPAMIQRLADKNAIVESEGAKVIPVEEETDNPPVPPLILVKSDGGYNYATTDMATVEDRVETIKPNRILYVVDKRQSLHFVQVFRAAARTGIAAGIEFEHIGFGTVNGKDGKPFKTRAGGVMRLSHLLDMAKETAQQRIDDAEMALDYPQEERERIAEMVGIGAIKFADLANQRMSDYIFDLDRFTTFEGKTGPYLQYAVVRIRSLLRKADAQGFAPGAIGQPSHETERSMLLFMSRLPEFIGDAHKDRSPTALCNFVYGLAQEFTRFYEACHIMSETDEALRASRLGLVQLVLSQFELVMQILGVPLPERM